MSKMIMLVGVPASGKSSFARNFIKDKKCWVIVNRDSFRNGRGDYWIPEQEPYIDELEESAIRLALDKKLNVLIDSTNLNTKTQLKWSKIASEYSASLDVKHFEIEYKEAVERDSKRDNPVGKKVIRGFFRKYFPEKLYVNEQDRPQLRCEYPKKDCIIVDLDGTMCLMNRNPYDYNSVDLDIPFKPVITFINLFKYKIDIFFVSGRDNTSICREKTIQWLNKHFMENYDYESMLFMKNETDPKNTAEFKKLIWETKIKPDYNVLAVFEDDAKVTEMFRNEGVLVCKVWDRVNV